jgi:hypothetical protein
MQTWATAKEQHKARIGDLSRELEETRSRLKPPENLAKSLSSREREGMLKVIYAMAVRGYRYDPSASRGDAVPDILSDLSQEGLSLSDDTVRRYLKAAEGLREKWLDESS